MTTTMTMTNTSTSTSTPGTAVADTRSVIYRIAQGARGGGKGSVGMFPESFRRAVPSGGLLRQRPSG